MREFINADVLSLFDGRPGARSLYEALAGRLLSEFGDVEIRAQKTQVSFYDGRMFA